MSNPFEWLREQYTQRKALWEDKSVADRASANKHIGTWNKALEILDAAEKQWNAKGSVILSLPCKPGDTVYALSHNGLEPIKVRSMEWYPEMSEAIRFWYNREGREGDWFFYAEDVGKTIFTSKEQAKNVLFPNEEDKRLKGMDEYIEKLKTQPAGVAKVEAIEALTRTGVINREEEQYHDEVFNNFR